MNGPYAFDDPRLGASSQPHNAPPCLLPSFSGKLGAMQARQHVCINTGERTTLTDFVGRWRRS